MDKRFILAVGVILPCLIAGLGTSLWASQNTDATPEKPQQILQFLHEDYPPYVYKEAGKVVGQVADLTLEIARRAGYAIEWRQTSYRRLVREIQVGPKALCATGYSDGHQAVYRVLASKPIAWLPGAALAIKMADTDLFSRHGSIEDILNDVSLRGAFVMGLDYQGVSKDVLAGKVARHIMISGSDTDLGLLVARGRVHFAPLNPDQTAHLKATHVLASNLMVYQPTGMKPPRKTGFICSMAIDLEIWRRLNDAIEPLPAYEGWE